MKNVYFDMLQVPKTLRCSRIFKMSYTLNKWNIWEILNIFKLFTFLLKMLNFSEMFIIYKL